YAELEKRGPAGLVAVNLFRAQKCSTRAKVYRGRSYRDMAYDRKSWSMGNLVEILKLHGAALAIAFGWRADPLTPFGDAPSWVLYIDLPQGQVSFHSPSRGEGPEYICAWDGQRKKRRADHSILRPGVCAGGCRVIKREELTNPK